MLATLTTSVAGVRCRAVRAKHPCSVHRVETGPQVFPGLPHVMLIVFVCAGAGQYMGAGGCRGTHKSRCAKHPFIAIVCRAITLILSTNAVLLQCIVIHSPHGDYPSRTVDHTVRPHCQLYAKRGVHRCLHPVSKTVAAERALLKVCTLACCADARRSRPDERAVGGWQYKRVLEYLSRYGIR